MTPCVFCRIVTGDLPASIVADNGHAVAFLDLRQFHAGHVLVVPREHVNDIREAGEDSLAGLFGLVAQVTRAVSAEFPGDGLSLWHSIGEGAHQEVPHMHIHVHPRMIGDDVLRVYPSSPAHPDRATLDDWALRLRRRMASERG